MSFALRPSDRAARLLAPARASSGSNAFSECTERVQGAIQAVQQHAASIRKNTDILATTQCRTTSSQHMKEVARVARDTVAEARRLLSESDPSSGRASTDEKRLHSLTHKKLSENLDAASRELEQRWKAFVEVETAWARQKGAGAMEMQPPQPEAADVESGLARTLQLREAHAVSEAEVEFHADMVDEYSRDVAGLAEHMLGMQRAVCDLAEHVQAQGETLDSIEASLGQAAQKTGEAAEQLRQTDQAQRKGKVWTACLFLVAVSVSATVIAVVWH